MDGLETGKPVPQTDTQPQTEQVSPWPKPLYLIKPSGFCAGIVRTEETFDRVTELFPDEKKYVAGTPAHNETVIKKFEDQGFVMVDDIQDVPSGAITIAGPHGSTAEDRKTAKEKGLLFFDTECPLVRTVREGIQRDLIKGKTVILWGKKGHAETRAHLGVNTEKVDEQARGRLLLGQTAEEILSPEFLSQIEDPEQVAFYAQTTHNAEEALRIRKELAEGGYPKITSLSADGICFATSNRQIGVLEMKRIAKKRKENIGIIVVGSRTSSNTGELYDLTADEAGQLGVLVLNAEELEAQRHRLAGYDALAVTAGASAPDADILGVIKWLVANGSNPPEMLQLGTDESKYYWNTPEPQDFRRNA